MQDETMTKEQLIIELHELHERVAELEKKRAQRKRVEEALEESEDRYHRLAESIPGMVFQFVLHKDGSFSLPYVNERIMQYAGIFPEAAMAEPSLFFAAIHPDDGEMIRQAISISARTLRNFSVEHRLIDVNGRLRWFRVESTPQRLSNGDIVWNGFSIDITGRKRVEEELRNYRERLEDLIEARTAELGRANERLTLEIEERRRVEDALKLFAYSVAHDLKSPAVGIYGLTKRLHKLSRDVLDEKSRSYCDQILKVSEHIAALVEMLNVYIATKEAHLSFEKTTLKEILGMLEDEFSVQLNIRQIDWIVPDSEVEITADRLSLVRVFRNLVDNALKYGGERLSRIRIGHEERGDCHIFSVIDDGKGLKGADSEKIFGLFHRHATSRGVEGAGLGLAIVKEIAQQHGGRAWVEPAAKEGTTFCICISKNLWNPTPGVAPRGA